MGKGHRQAAPSGRRRQGGIAQCSPQLPCRKRSIVTCQWSHIFLSQAADHSYWYPMSTSDKPDFCGGAFCQPPLT